MSGSRRRARARCSAAPGCGPGRDGVPRAPGPRCCPRRSRPRGPTRCRGRRGPRLRRPPSSTRSPGRRASRSARLRRCRTRSAGSGRPARPAGTTRTRRCPRLRRSAGRRARSPPARSRCQRNPPARVGPSPSSSPGAPPLRRRPTPVLHTGAAPHPGDRRGPSTCPMYPVEARAGRRGRARGGGPGGRSHGCHLADRAGGEPSSDPPNLGYMADPSTYRPAVGSIPESPGVYKFRDPNGRVVYVGKAKNLRQRLNSYFADVAGLHPRTRQMVTTAAAVEWTVVGTEVEALQLEYNWIKEFDPRFNVRYRDDKSYPSLAVTLNEEYPRLQVMRGPKKKGVRYFGPYAHAWAIRETLDTLTRVFPARTCSTGVFKRAGQIGRPCLLGYIGKCAAPCVGRVSAEEHRRIVDDFCDFMAGRTEQMVKRLEREMGAAAEAMEYEKAARLRDDLGALKRAMEKQAVVLGDGTDADVVAFAQDELEASVQVFHVRGGRVTGQRGWIVDKVEEVTTGELVEQFLLQVYGGVDEETGVGEAGEAVPKEVLVPELPDDADVYTELLEELRGGRVSLRVPQRGDKRSLLETVERNAKEAFARHRVKRASDLTARSLALSELQEALELPDAPLRIECIDISHVQGTNVVASMVVFEDGLAKKSDYRRFSVTHGTDDTAARSEEHTSELQSRQYLVCRLLLEKKKNIY